MNIEYLKHYKENEKILKSIITPPKGLSIAEIEAIENSINSGKKLPKAMREFLFIGGKRSCLTLSGGPYDRTDEYRKELVEERGIAIDRPFIVFDDENGGGAFTFIYLDEGDNPQPYFASLHPGFDNEGDIIWKNNFRTFSEFIDYYVYLAINNLAP